MKTWPPAQRERALDLAAGLVRPARASGALVERPDLAVPVARVDEAAGHQRRRLGGADRVPPAAPCRGRRSNAITSPSAPGTGSSQLGGRPMNVREHDVGRDGAGDDQPQRSRGLAAPDQLPGLRVQRVEAAGEGRADRPGRRPARAGTRAARGRGTSRSSWTAGPQAHRGVEAHPLVVVAEGRPVQGLVHGRRLARRLDRRRRRGRHELDRRRARHVAALVLDVERVCRRHAGEHDQHEPRPPRITAWRG